MRCEGFAAKSEVETALNGQRAVVFLFPDRYGCRWALCGFVVKGQSVTRGQSAYEHPVAKRGRVDRHMSGGSMRMADQISGLRLPVALSL